MHDAAVRKPPVAQLHDVLERPAGDGSDALVPQVASEQNFRDSALSGAMLAPDYVDSMQASLNDTRPGAASAEINGAVSRPPTFADVRAWVAAGGDNEEIEIVTSPAPVFRGAPATPARHLVPAQSSTQPAAIYAAGPADNYTLEIGSIQIVVDEPRVPAPQTATIPARTEQPAADHSWTLRSRHYLR
jgi:hypothetical protein